MKLYQVKFSLTHRKVEFIYVMVDLFLILATVYMYKMLKMRIIIHCAFVLDLIYIKYFKAVPQYSWFSYLKVGFFFYSVLKDNRT